MEAKFGGEAHRFYSPGGKNEGKKSLDWDLNDWKWDGDLFIATPLNSSVDYRSKQLFPTRNGIQVAGILSNTSSFCSEETDTGNEIAKRELEKRRRVVVCDEDELNDHPGNLSLKLGGQVYPIDDSNGQSGKKTKLSSGTPLNRAACQVEDCAADLSIAKDYHRRHKVCEMHSKASKALVGNAFQRFCQQCSRFHVLQEFDEGKRSCRRRLAGHNRRRRKTHPETTVNGSSVNDGQSSNYLLISLLRILSNMHSNNSVQAKDQDLLSHLLRNLANCEGTIDGLNMSGNIQESKQVVSVEGTAGASLEQRVVSNGHQASRQMGSTSQIDQVIDAHGPQIRAVDQNTHSASEVLDKGMTVDNIPDGVMQTVPFARKGCSPGKALTSNCSRRNNINNFDLNYIYNDSQDCEVMENSKVREDTRNGALGLPSWMQKNSHQSSPPQSSMNSDSLSGQSPSSSGGDTQSRTDRIVFKLFGKDPNNFPVGLRSQILNWLSHSPTDIESYIRPGCIVLTIYLRLAESTWKELRDDLGSSLIRLLDVADDAFWRTGWVYARVQHHIAFIYNGQIVLDTALPLTSPNHTQIASVTPIAVSLSETAKFLVKGCNLSRPTARLLCALEGKYLLQRTASELLERGSSEEHNETQCLSFPCSIPSVTGRGFLEVEDHGLSSGFFPFIVAEQDVCTEIRTLESAVESTELNGDTPGSSDKMRVKNQALDFIHEMGWLLRRSHLRSKLGHTDSNSDIFPFTRFKWLVEFSVDHDWCAVVKKLLDVLFDGNVGPGGHLSAELAMLEIGLLHRAVRRRCRKMVELLLRYEPKKPVKNGSDSFLFRPDAVGPAGLTPLHLAANSDGSETLLDSLTDDPGQVGVQAWKTIRDNTGLTPEDYTRLRSHHSYIQLIHKKSNKKATTSHVVLDIPDITSFQIAKSSKKPKIQQYCKACDQQLAYGNMNRSLVYRPAFLSMLAIAAVCVCVSLFFKSSPEVLFVYPFRWELLDYGSS